MRTTLANWNGLPAVYGGRVAKVQPRPTKARAILLLRDVARAGHGVATDHVWLSVPKCRPLPRVGDAVAFVGVAVYYHRAGRPGDFGLLFVSWDTADVPQRMCRERLARMKRERKL